jgi:hypothetical protein
MKASMMVCAFGAAAALAIMAACDSNVTPTQSTGTDAPPGHHVPGVMQPAPRSALVKQPTNGAAIVNPASFAALASTSAQTQWFYFRSQANGVWYIVNSFGQIYALDGVGSSFYLGIGWQPINQGSYQGYASAGANFSAVTVAADGRTVAIGAAAGGGLSDRAIALQNTTQNVAWLYFQDARGWWYISDANAASQVYLLADTDPSIQGGMGWQPVYNATFPGYPSAGQTFASVSLGAGRRSTIFGAASVAALVLTPDSVILHPGDTTRVQVQALDVTGNATTLPILTWQSRTAGITVSSSGLIQADRTIATTIPNGVVQVSSGAISAQLRITVVVPPAADTGYVQIRWIGAVPSPAVATAFEAARSRINGLFKSFDGIAAGNLNLTPGTCMAGAPAFNELVRGVVLFVQVAPIDGPYNIIGSAGPCITRSATWIPIAGSMTFDSTDMDFMLTTGILPGVVLHEMMHTIGFGTIWGPGQLNLVPAPNSSDPRYFGSNGVSAYAELGAADAASGVPVENIGGPGSVGSHWRESVFHTELMTSVATGSMMMSRVTVGALRDFGYDVDMNKADPYTFSSALTASLLRPAQRIVELTSGPIGVLGPSGRITPYAGPGHRH